MPDTAPTSAMIDVPGKVLEGAGRALYGDTWQSELSRTLKLNLRTVQRWAEAARADDTYKVPPGVLADLMRTLDRKHMPLERAIEDLRRYYDGEG